MGDLLGLLLAVLVLTVVTAVALVSGRGRMRTPPAARSASSTKVGAPRPGVDYRPGTGDDAEVPRDTPLRTVDVVDLPDDAMLLDSDTSVVGPVLEVPEPTTGGMMLTGFAMVGGALRGRRTKAKVRVSFAG